MGYPKRSRRAYRRVLVASVAATVSLFGLVACVDDEEEKSENEIELDRRGFELIEEVPGTEEGAYYASFGTNNCRLILNLEDGVWVATEVPSDDPMLDNRDITEAKLMQMPELAYCFAESPDHEPAPAP